LNAEFAEAMVKRERADHLRLQRQRAEWERREESRAPSDSLT
jgi:hypothetical protein